MFRTIIRRCSSLESTMVRVLNVAEKNDAAKSLSDLMSRGRYRRVSFSHISRIERFVDYWYRRRFAPKTVGTHVHGRLVPSRAIWDRRRFSFYDIDQFYLKQFCYLV